MTVNCKIDCPDFLGSLQLLHPSGASNEYIFAEGLHPSLWYDALSGLLSRQGHVKLNILNPTTLMENIHKSYPERAVFV